jgi:spermidine/putrescine transport system permease protein
MAGSSVAVSRGGRRALTLYFACFLAFLYVPLALMFGISFGRNFSGLPWTGFTLDWYREAYSPNDLSAQSSIWRAIFNSVWIGLIVATVDTTLALMFAYGMARGQRVIARPAILALCVAPLAAPPAAYGAAVLVLARRGPFTTDFGLHLVVLAHTILFLPIAILFLLPRVAAIGREILETAEDLGARNRQTLRKVVIPMVRPALVAAFMTTFLFSFNEPVVAGWLVDRQITYPVYLFSVGRGSAGGPLVSAVATAGYAVVVVAIVVLQLGARRTNRQGAPT